MVRRTFLKIVLAFIGSLTLPDGIFAGEPDKVYFPAKFKNHMPPTKNRIRINGQNMSYSDMKMIQTYSSEEAMFFDGENVPYFDVLNGGFLLKKNAYWSLLPLYNSENVVHVETKHDVITVDGQAQLTGLYQGTTNGGFTFAYFSFFEPELSGELVCKEDC
jgi:hypothetical protein